MLLYCFPSPGEGQVSEGKQDSGGRLLRNSRISLGSAVDLRLSVYMGPMLRASESALQFTHMQCYAAAIKKVILYLIP